mmetsp:Transcript_2612/g.6097  ORF Transcript_2612/g.6097 Transcript_2612/m.6097 type:complete len:287 (-) Transcript_2612:241-1101(-)|eukprot:CAMPEP_0170596242 /NCGR_PEP_ID=MMETSP0224-20130122/15004_1 /TAXON_ID=285029 /ORGANISM="Togula jolla, Strain CCCM 725" /LENGTH=286 /DNA_ID=CAMNT_0010920503 /DNA_START=163 /DNA_END=1023 /DNA_ORIENTATION=-
MCPPRDLLFEKAFACQNVLQSKVAPSSWDIVWCHERCHKDALTVRRRNLQNAAHHVDGSLECFKKAAKFAVWLAEAEVEPERSAAPYVLFTDWREVKPCMEHLLSHHPVQKPLATIVHCESRVHFIRATAWMHTLGPEAGLVLVNDHLDLDNACSTKSFFSNLRQRLLGSAKVPKKFPATLREVHLTKDRNTATKTAMSKRLTEAVGPRPVTLEVAASEPLQDKSNHQHLMTSAPLGTLQPPMLLMLVPQPCTPQPCNAPLGVPEFGQLGHLEVLLKLAMPDHYDE